MGGYGSGWRGTVSPRCTVEDSLTLDGYKLLSGINKKLGEGNRYASGVVSWRRGCNVPHSKIRYGYSCGKVNLSYKLIRTGEVSNYPVLLASTAQPKGSIRYWFQCPLRGCGRMVAKLYLPTGAKYFGCRLCYNLTYESCNESRRSDSLFKRLAC